VDKSKDVRLSLLRYRRSLAIVSNPVCRRKLEDMIYEAQKRLAEIERSGQEPPSP